MNKKKVIENTIAIIEADMERQKNIIRDTEKLLNHNTFNLFSYSFLLFPAASFLIGLRSKARVVTASAKIIKLVTANWMRKHVVEKGAQLLKVLF